MYVNNVAQYNHTNTYVVTYGQLQDRTTLHHTIAISRPTRSIPCPEHPKSSLPSADKRTGRDRGDDNHPGWSPQFLSWRPYFFRLFISFFLATPLAPRRPPPFDWNRAISFGAILFSLSSSLFSLCLTHAKPQLPVPSNPPHNMILLPYPPVSSRGLSRTIPHAFGLYYSTVDGRSFSRVVSFL